MTHLQRELNVEDDGIHRQEMLGKMRIGCDWGTITASFPATEPSISALIPPNPDSPWVAQAFPRQCGLDVIRGRSQLPFPATEPSMSSLIPPNPDSPWVAQAFPRQCGQALVDNDYQEQNSTTPNLPYPSRIISTQTAGNGFDIIGGRSHLPFPVAEPSMSALIPPNPDPDPLWMAQAFPRQSDTRFNTNPTTLAVQLVWDRPNVEPSKRHWNLLDQLMLLRKFNNCGLPTMRLMQENLELTISKEVMQTRRNRGVIIEPLEPDDSDEERQLRRKMCSKYKLRFVNKVCEAYHTRDPIKAHDGSLLKVALFDENRKITYGPLSSASVQIVVLHGDFNDHSQDYCTSEEFSCYEVCPRPGEKPSSVLGGNCVLVLADGEACLGDAFFQTTSFCARTGKFKLGVRLASAHEERIQGVSEPFWVKDRHFAGQALVDNDYQEQNNPMPNLPHSSRINAGKRLDIIGGQPKLPFEESATRKRNIVIRVDMSSDQCRTKAMKVLAATPEVDSVTVTGDARDQLLLVGDGVDFISLVSTLCRKVGPAEVVQVAAEAKEGGRDKKPPAAAAAAAVSLPPYVPSTWYNQYPPQPLSFVYEAPVAGYRARPDSMCSIMYFFDTSKGSRAFH